MSTATSAPLVAFLATRSEGEPSARIARWLARGFEQLDVRYDAVYLEGPRDITQSGTNRGVRLGSVHASRSTHTIAAYLRWASPAAMLVGSSFVAPFAVAAGIVTRRPVIPWEPAFLRREVPNLRFRDRLIPLAQRLTYPRAPQIAVVSNDVGRELSAALGGRVPDEKMFVLPNPVDGDEVRRLAGGAAQNGGRFSLCAVGRLSPEKGYDVLISALDQAKDRLGDWELTVIGEGKLRGSLLRQARNAGLEKRITLLGRMANPYPTLASADVLVHAARWDGCPLVLCEALSLGIPVVATRAPGGTRETLADGEFGLLVPPEDPEALASALVRIASSPSLRSGYAAAGPARAASFSPEQIARRIVVRLESLLDAA